MPRQDRICHCLGNNGEAGVESSQNLLERGSQKELCQDSNRCWAGEPIFYCRTHAWGPHTQKVIWDLTKEGFTNTRGVIKNSADKYPGYNLWWRIIVEINSLVFRPSYQLSFSHRVAPNSLATLWTVAYQVPLFTGFPRSEYQSVLPFPPPGDLPDPRIRPVSPARASRFFTTEPPGKPKYQLGLH